jgi:hypothetical protein
MYKRNLPGKIYQQNICAPGTDTDSKRLSGMFYRTYAQDLNGWREAEGMSRLGPLEIL